MKNEKMNWQNDAVCREIGSEPFLDQETIENNWHTIKKVCESCPVQQECLDFAVENQYFNGIYGGKGGTARKKMGRLLIKGEQ